jgi:hypothetical protein
MASVSLQNRSAPRASCVVALTCAMACAAMVGCGGGPDVDPEKASQIRAEAPGVFETVRSSKKKAEASGSESASSGGWAIALGGAVPGGQSAAIGALDRARRAGLASARLEKRGERMLIMYGDYAAPDDPMARADLERIRGIVADGVKPYASAMLTPPEAERLEGSVPEYDLSTAKRRFGKRALYTLQVAVYQKEGEEAPTESELAQIRAAAEKAAIDLRRGGEEAFYYHGPRRSTVTVGILSQDDTSQGGVIRDSMRVRELQRRHPLNLVNGQGVRTRVKGQQEFELQKSFLVAIPE